MSIAVVGALTVDDIVTSDGQLHQQVAGGNALYAAFGAALWTSDVRLVTVAGAGWPQESAGWLTERGVDVDGLVHSPELTVQLWILYDPDGTRQIFYKRRSGSLRDLEPLVAPSMAELLTASSGVGWLHVAALPVAVQTALLAGDAAGPCITLDSLEAVGSVGGDLPAYWDSPLLSSVTVFLPSHEELELITSSRPGSPLQAMCQAHASLRQLVVKSGADGAVVHDVQRRERVRVPVFPTTVRDPTGAGDVFCGAFLAGMDSTGDAVEAAVRGSASASFVIEGVGAEGLRAVTSAGLEQRADAVRARLERSPWPAA